MRRKKTYFCFTSELLIRSLFTVKTWPQPVYYYFFFSFYNNPLKIHYTAVTWVLAMAPPGRIFCCTSCFLMWIPVLPGPYCRNLFQIEDGGLLR